ncbi:MAG: hypothetical protein MJ240_07505 [Kiritimatiellae bacterium]|nr:hypothetical protein [Kiritimatiellia bacterium]
MSRIPWMEELIEGELPDGTPVKAMCWYWAKDVNVEMISPYPGLRTGLHMMYMIPMRFTDGELWKKRAWGMIATLVVRGRWIDAHPDAVKERRQEGKRRIGIARKYIKMLKDERADWKRKLKKGLVDLRTYQRNINPITKAIQPLELIIHEQDEFYWLRDGIVVPSSYPVQQPYPSKCPGLKNVHVYWQDSVLVSDPEKGWDRVLETQIPEADFAVAGLGDPVDGRSAIDLAAFSAYLKRRACDKSGVILDARREIARVGDAWCATMA